MTTIRIVSYNILCGGTGREEAIEAIVRSLHPTIAFLQEIHDDGPIRAMAERLGMQATIAPPTAHSDARCGALVAVDAATSIIPCPDSLRHAVTVTLPTAGPPISFHGVHLAARFGERQNGEIRRLREVGHLLTALQSEPESRHVLVGDFNAIAPRDVVRATLFFRKLHALAEAGVYVSDVPYEKLRDIRPKHLRARHAIADMAEVESSGIAAGLRASVQPLPTIAMLATSWMPVSHQLDIVLNRGIRRKTVQRLLDAGFVDAFRYLHRRSRGYTCATWIPATRIDYAFLPRDLLPSLVSCDVVGSVRHPSPDVRKASDHFPLLTVLDLPG